MACRSCIYAVNTASTDVVSGGALPFSTIVRRRSREFDLGGNSIVIADVGSNYYLVNVSATFTVPEAGDVKLDLHHNGDPVVGGTATTTVSTTDTVTGSLSFSAIVRTFNNTGIDTLSVINSGVEATFENMTISVIKL